VNILLVRGRRAIAAATLIEALISGACFSTVAAGVLATMTQGVRTAGASQETLRATQILNEQMEGIRLYTWDQVTSNGFIPETFTAPFYSNQSSASFNYTGHVSIINADLTESYSNDVKWVTVTLDWNRQGVPETRTMKSLISRYGLHNYYYDCNQ
jgi:type II secretory pathway pseudopilin PulG